MAKIEIENETRIWAITVQFQHFHWEQVDGKWTKILYNYLYFVDISMCTFLWKCYFVLSYKNSRYEFQKFLVSDLEIQIAGFIEENLGIKRNRAYIEFNDAPKDVVGWNGTTFQTIL